MGKPSDAPGFQALKRKWDRILDEVGFSDQEDAYGNLKQTAAGIYARYGGRDSVSRGAREQFYRELGARVARARFPRKVERFILEGVAAGLTQVGIQRRLAAAGIRLHRVTIGRIVKKWLTAWGLR